MPPKVAVITPISMATVVPAPIALSPQKLDRFWLESSASIPRLGGAESDEGLEVFGRPEGVHFEARG
jgi:hypothetical protein